MPSPQPSEIAVPSITREVLSSQGLIKGVGSKKKLMQQPKKRLKKDVNKMLDPKAFNINKLQAEDAKKQGGKTPASVIKQIKEKGAYDVKYGPGLYKKKKK